MKKLNLVFGLAMAAALIFVASDTQAQRRGGMKGFGQGAQYNNRLGFIPDLTAEQQDKIQDIRSEYARANLDLRNKVNERRASLRTVTTQENPDMKKANSLLEEISDLQLELAKNRLQCRMAVREELTDDQKIYFDQTSRRGMMKNRGFSNDGMQGRRFNFNCPR